MLLHRFPFRTLRQGMLCRVMLNVIIVIYIGDIKRLLAFSTFGIIMVKIRTFAIGG